MPTWTILARRRPVLSPCDVLNTAATAAGLCHKVFRRGGARIDGLGAVPAIACIVPTICCDGGLTTSGKPARLTADAGNG